VLCATSGTGFCERHVTLVRKNAGVWTGKAFFN
jgi:hypothetical protein